MLDKFLKFIQKWYRLIVTIVMVLVLIAFLFSCQGLFNVNVKDSNSNVVLNDSLKTGGSM